MIFSELIPKKIDIFTDFRDVGKAFQNLHFSENQKRQAITLRVLKHELPSICHVLSKRIH